MSTIWRLVYTVVVWAVTTTLIVSGGTASAGVAQSQVVSAVPSAQTPQVLDNTVLDMAQVGGRIVVAGSFTQVRDARGNGSRLYAQPYVFAFDPATGALDPAFRPALNGVVTTVIAGPGNTVYLGGRFYSVNGVGSRNLAQISLATGQAIRSFQPPKFNGAINDLVLTGNRLLVAGVFTTVGNVPHGGLASVNAATGALDAYLGVDVAGNHNYPRGKARGGVGVENMALSPDRTRLVVIGNFRTADGLARDQAMTVLLQPDRAVVDPNWRTRRFEPACAADRVDSYVRDVDFAPDGSYFVIVTTGGRFAGTLCDAAARFDTADRGLDVQPRWVDSTGGDSLWSVEVTGSAVYVGGHQKFMNNPDGGVNTASANGGVPRPGLAALDPLNGLPLTWNGATHPRGVGTQKLLATSTGLYIGGDTEYIGNYQYKRPRLAFFPLAGGTAVPSQDTGSLPGNVVLAGRATSSGGLGVGDVARRYFTGSATPAPDAKLATGGTDWSRARGAFRVGSTLFYGYPAGTGYALYRRTFDGTTFGSATMINPYLDPKWSNVKSGSRDGAGRVIYYRGALPAFYGQLGSVTAMFYSGGRVYYTRSGSSALYYRYFSVDAGVVGAQEFTAATVGFGSVAGMFAAGGGLFYANVANGELRRLAFVNGAPSGVSSVAAPGPSAGGRDWRTRAMFLAPPANGAPTAAFASNCLGLVCTFDARGSTDADGTVASYAWTFGDGRTGSGPTPSHTFAAAGTYPVTLTVTDDDGARARRAASVTVAPAATGKGIAFRGSVERRVSSSSVSVTVPPSVQAGDGLLLVLSVNSSSVAVTPPAGWMQKGVQSSGNISTRVLSKVATAADANSTVTASLSAAAKATVQLIAYSGTSVTNPVASVTGAVDVGGTAHATPAASAAAGSWVVSVWSDKQLVARTWTAPGGVTVRSNLAGASNGGIATLIADSGAAMPAGPVGRLTATVPTASNQATMFTVVLAVGDGAPSAT